MDKPQNDVKNKDILKVLWQAAWRYRGYVTGAIVLTPVGTLCFRLLPPLVAAGVIDKLSRGDYITGKIWQSFGNDILLFSSILAFGGILIYRVNIYLIHKLETMVMRDLLRKMHDHYIQLDNNFHSNNFGGSLVSRANKLIGSYIRLADSLVFQVIPTLTSFVFIMAVMYPRSPKFVWLFIILSTTFVISGYLLSRKVRILSADEAAAQNKNTGSLADAITNVVAIKSFSASTFEKKLFNEVTEETRGKSLKVMWATITRDTFASFITAGIQIAALVLGVIAIVNKSGDIGTIFLMISYSAFMADALWQFNSQTLRNFNRAMGDAHEAVATLKTLPEVQDIDKPEKLAISKGEIEFKDVTFDHADSSSEQNTLFHNLNLHIKSGEKIGLVGRSGGGKTTITRLILRFMDIDGGKITIDDQDISKITQDDLRSIISYVPQEPLLFHRTLAENIGYGDPSAAPERIKHAAKLAHAHEFIKDLPSGYDTLVGERGIKLSGGQRQRVAIARAMIKKAPILLLDEATSALDSESEALIQDALWKLMQNKTAIVIAHRLSTIQRLDRIIVLEKGHIIEDGSHKDLLAKKGHYAKLWAHQSGGFLED